MRRWLYIATLCLFTVPIFAPAQRHGGGMHSGPMSGRGFAPTGRGFADRGFAPAGRGFARPNPSFFRGEVGFGRHQRFGVFAGNRGFFGRRNRFLFRDRFFFNNGFGFNNGFFSPFGSSFGFFGYPIGFPYQSSGEDYGPEPVVTEVQPPSSDANQLSDLSRRIDRLIDDVEHLRDQRSQSNVPDGRVPDQPTTVLVFKDKHVEQVRNYAVVGQTLWLLADNNVNTKIPLSDIDLAETHRVNNERGIKFHAPRPRPRESK